MHPKIQALLSHERIYYCPTCLGNFQSEPGTCTRHEKPVPLQSVATATIMTRLSKSIDHGSKIIDRGLQRVTQELTKLNNPKGKKRK